MALTPLAAVADLTARGITATDATWALAAASDAVRDAAGGVTISRHTGTVYVDGTVDQRIGVPGWAIDSVTDVRMDGQLVTDWRYVDGRTRLWRAAGWQPGYEPVEVEMTVTQGVTAVDADIVDLVCSLAAGALHDAEEKGYGADRGLAYERIDDYQRGFRQGDDEILSPVELPAATRQMLAQRFGVAATTTDTD